MGTCKYCSKPVGFLRSKHAECEEKNRQRERLMEGGRQQIAITIERAILSCDSFDNLENNILEIEKSSFVPFIERKALLIKGWENSVEQFLEDGILDVIEEKRLIKFKERFTLSQSDLDKNGALTKITKAAVLRDVLNGEIPQRMSVDGNLSINPLLSKTAKIQRMAP